VSKAKPAEGQESSRSRYPPGGGLVPPKCNSRCFKCFRDLSLWQWRPEGRGGVAGRPRGPGWAGRAWGAPAPERAPAAAAVRFVSTVARCRPQGVGAWPRGRRVFSMAPVRAALRGTLAVSGAVNFQRPFSGHGEAGALPRWSGGYARGRPYPRAGQNGGVPCPGRPVGLGPGPPPARPSSLDPPPQCPACAGCRTQRCVVTPGRGSRPGWRRRGGGGG